MSLISDMQAIGKLLKKTGSLGPYEKLLALQEKVLALIIENTELKKEIDRLKDAAELKAHICFEHDAYWLKNGNEEEKDGPFCPICYDSEGKLMRLLSRLDSRFSRCPRCSLSLPFEKNSRSLAQS